MELAEVQQVHKFATRLKTALSTEMRGGRIYEIDTRLRPSGASGAPTVRLATLENHQLSHAKTWEHLALVPARFGIGPDFAQSAFDEVRRLVLTKHRNQKQLVRDAHSMLDQLRTHRITKPKPGTIELKLMPGGLMEAEYLTAFLVLKHAANMPEMAQVPYRGLADCLEQEHPEVAGLSGALTFLQNVHFYERLYGWTGLKIEKLNLTDHPINQSNSELEAELLKTTNLISRFIAQEITSCSGLTKKGLTAYREERVVWAIEA